MFHVDNAIIMAAGMSSRFIPLSYEKPKALLEVKGEILIERQIRQLKAAGISEIIVVVGYMAEKFEYLRDRFGVILVKNHEYLTRNNHSSIYAAKDYLKNTYICSADNYFLENPFEQNVLNSYYAAIYAEGKTKEWCLHTDESGRIICVQVGGENAWYMMGHAFWDQEFSKRFQQCLETEYDKIETKNMFWEDIYIKHIDTLNMMIRRYDKECIFEFDSLDELREFDESYIDNTRSEIIKSVAERLNAQQKDIGRIVPAREQDSIIGFYFCFRDVTYRYCYANKALQRIAP
ncbi:MAG: NTP transferase domain-containing protein [Clostridia bacterium]|nr:NTP transferase domain-containing protein [Clostridia bacterium]